MIPHITTKCSPTLVNKMIIFTFQSHILYTYKQCSRHEKMGADNCSNQCVYGITTKQNIALLLHTTFVNICDSYTLAQKSKYKKEKKRLSLFYLHVTI